MNEAGRAAPAGSPGDWVELGKVNGVFGVRGWVKVYSYTRPRERILDYPAWRLGSRSANRVHALLDGRLQGQGIVACLEGVDDRDAALALVGQAILVAGSDLEPAGPDEYYWRDLIGLEAVTAQGVVLGRVTGLMETGANDVLEIRGERDHLVPFTADAVKEVDPVGRRIVVDWDPDF